MKLLVHLPLFFSILFISLPSSKSCTPNDKNALLQIKKSFNNPPFLSSWTPQTDCCTGWTGVECTNGRVTYLYLSSSEISGNIPPAITKLKSLNLLFLKHSNLYGLIPDNISDLKNLTFLDLSYNQLTSPIPGSLSQMSKLEAIQINDNKLTGSIPNSFGSFVGNVPVLHLSNNLLSDQRALGMSMRVERSSLEQVQERYEVLKKRKTPGTFTEQDLDERIRKQQEEEEELKRQRREKKEREEEREGSKEEPEMDPEVAEMKGFGGFGSSKKS